MNPLTLLRMAPYIVIALLLAWGMRVNHLRERWHHQYVAEHAGRLQDRATYEQAQKNAAAQNKAHVADVEAQQKRISDETQSAYASDHAELIRLRQQQRASKGSTGGTGSSPPTSPAQGADGDELQLSPDEHLQASEIELRLMHLQNWVEQQLQIDPNK